MLLSMAFSAGAAAALSWQMLSSAASASKRLICGSDCWALLPTHPCCLPAILPALCCCTAGSNTFKGQQKASAAPAGFAENAAPEGRRPSKRGCTVSSFDSSASLSLSSSSAPAVECTCSCTPKNQSLVS